MGRLDCQRGDILARHGAVERLRWRIAQGLGIRSGIRGALAPRKKVGPLLGKPSRFEVGDWVRVRERAEVEATFDRGARLRGLVWVPSQWDACGRVFRVQKQVLRIIDDGGTMRAVSGTVLLEGCDCGGALGDAGCGRRCPLMFRDEWLEAADAPAAGAGAAAPDVRHARVLPLAAIRETLDGRGRLDGVQFSSDMERFSGAVLPILRRLDSVYELNQWCPPRAPLYLLAGAPCGGTAIGARGPCHRACALVWHADWLELDPP